MLVLSVCLKFVLDVIVHHFSFDSLALPGHFCAHFLLQLWYFCDFCLPTSGSVSLTFETIVSSVLCFVDVLHVFRVSCYSVVCFLRIVKNACFFVVVVVVDWCYVVIIIDVYYHYR